MKKKAKRTPLWIDWSRNESTCMWSCFIRRRCALERSSKCYYIHNLASNPYQKGTGKLFFSYLESFTKEKGKEYLRLDSLRGNETLEDYYSMLGFVEKGTCVDRNYHGILRERKL